MYFWTLVEVDVAGLPLLLEHFRKAEAVKGRR